MWCFMRRVGYFVLNVCDSLLIVSRIAQRISCDRFVSIFSWHCSMYHADEHKCASDKSHTHLSLWQANCVRLSVNHSIVYFMLLLLLLMLLLARGFQIHLNTKQQQKVSKMHRNPINDSKATFSHSLISLAISWLSSMQSILTSHTANDVHTFIESHSNIIFLEDIHFFLTKCRKSIC